MLCYLLRATAVRQRDCWTVWWHGRGEGRFPSGSTTGCDRWTKGKNKRSVRGLGKGDRQVPVERHRFRTACSRQNTWLNSFGSCWYYSWLHVPAEEETSFVSTGRWHMLGRMELCFISSVSMRICTWYMLDLVRISGASVLRGLSHCPTPHETQICQRRGWVVLPLEMTN